jgi:hypothetical protein
MIHEQSHALPTGWSLARPAVPCHGGTLLPTLRPLQQGPARVSPLAWAAVGVRRRLGRRCTVAHREPPLPPAASSCLAQRAAGSYVLAELVQAGTDAELKLFARVITCMFELGGEKGGRGVDAAAARGCPLAVATRAAGRSGRAACGRRAYGRSRWDMGRITAHAVRSPQLKVEDRGLQAIAIVPPPLQYAGRIEEQVTLSRTTRSPAASASPGWWPPRCACAPTRHQEAHQVRGCSPSLHRPRCAR